MIEASAVFSFIFFFNAKKLKTTQIVSFTKKTYFVIFNVGYGMALELLEVVVTFLCLCKAAYSQCENTIVDKPFGEINHLPPATKDTDGQRCSWVLSPGSSKEDFILVIQFNYVASYDNNDQIMLPDGNLLPHRGIVFGREPYCRKYVLAGSAKLDCLEALKNTECPDVEVTEIYHPIRIALSSVPQFRPPSKLVYFTNFQLTFVFAFCFDKDKQNENMTTTEELPHLQFDDNNTKPVDYTTAIVLFSVFVILSGIVVFASLKHKCENADELDGRADYEVSNRNEQERRGSRLSIKTSNVLKEASLEDRRSFPIAFRRALEANEQPKQCTPCRHNKYLYDF